MGAHGTIIILILKTVRLSVEEEADGEGGPRGKVKRKPQGDNASTMGEGVLPHWEISACRCGIL